MKAVMQRVTLFVSIVSGGLGLLCGCGSMGYGCAAVILPGIVVSVYDARTGQPAAAGATAAVQDGNYTETLRLGGYDSNNVPLILEGADERPGTYIVRVTKPGYMAFEQSDVRVNRGDCNAGTVSLRADLVPLP